MNHCDLIGGDAKHFTASKKKSDAGVLTFSVRRLSRKNIIEGLKTHRKARVGFLTHVVPLTS